MDSATNKIGLKIFRGEESDMVLEPSTTSTAGPDDKPETIDLPVDTLDVVCASADPSLVSPCDLNSASPTSSCAVLAEHERSESIVQVIQHEVETKRIAVVRIEVTDRSFLVLRQQEWASGIGWFTQRSVEIDADQLGPLRCTLQMCGDCRSKPNKKQMAAAISQRGLKIVS